MAETRGFITNVGNLSEREVAGKEHSNVVQKILDRKQMVPTSSFKALSSYCTIHWTRGKGDDKSIFQLRLCIFHLFLRLCTLVEHFDGKTFVCRFFTRLPLSLPTRLKDLSILKVDNSVMLPRLGVAIYTPIKSFFPFFKYNTKLKVLRR